MFPSKGTIPLATPFSVTSTYLPSKSTVTFGSDSLLVKVNIPFPVTKFAPVTTPSGATSIVTSVAVLESDTFAPPINDLTGISERTFAVTRASPAPKLETVFSSAFISIPSSFIPSVPEQTTKDNFQRAS